MKKILFLQCGYNTIKTDYTKCESLYSQLGYFMVQGYKRYWEERGYQVYILKTLNDYYELCNNQYDDIMMFSNTYNFMGGKLSKLIELTQTIIANHQGKIYMHQDDPKYKVENGPANILDRLNQNKIELKYISRACVEKAAAVSDNIILFQPAGNSEVKMDKKYPIKNVEVAFNFKVYKYITEAKKDLINDDITIKKEFKSDIIYAGTLRPERVKVLKQYFDPELFDCSIVVHENSKIKTSKSLEKIKALPQFSYTQNLEYHSNHLSQLLILDDEHKNKFVTLRIFDALQSKCPIFIPIEMDKNKKIFEEDIILQDFCYISSKEELQKKIETLKNMPAFRNEIIIKMEQIQNPTFIKEIYAR